MFKLSLSSKSNREGIDQRLIEIDDLAIQLTLVDFGHCSLSGIRTAQTQHALFLDGKTECDGYNKLSKHQLGKALDFYAYVNGRASWQPDHLTMVACAYLQAASMFGYKVKWGGLFKSEKPIIINGVPYGWDLPHIELID